MVFDVCIVCNGGTVRKYYDKCMITFCGDVLNIYYDNLEEPYAYFLTHEVNSISINTTVHSNND